MSEIKVYTDGSASPNPGPGGYGVVIIYEKGGIEEIAAGYRLTTNNRMELLAVITALKHLNRRYTTLPYTTIYTDSQYVYLGITQWMCKWRERKWVTRAGTSVVNRDLWEILDELSQSHKIRFEWIKGHNNDPHNDRCDVLAKEVNHTLIDTMYEEMSNGD